MKKIRIKEKLFLHFFQEKEGAEWKEETVIAACEAEARHKLRTLPGRHDPDKVFDSAVDIRPLTKTDLVKIFLHSPKGSS